MFAFEIVHALLVNLSSFDRSLQLTLIERGLVLIDELSRDPKAEAVSCSARGHFLILIFDLNAVGEHFLDLLAQKSIFPIRTKGICVQLSEVNLRHLALLDDVDLISVPSD